MKGCIQQQQSILLLGMRSFVVAGPVICNSLPAALWTATLSPLTFARLLKTHLFSWSKEQLRCSLQIYSSSSCLSKFMRWINSPKLLMPNPTVAIAYRQLDRALLWSLCSQLNSHQFQRVDQVQTLWCLPAADNTIKPQQFWQHEFWYLMVHMYGTAWHQPGNRIFNKSLTN